MSFKISIDWPVLFRAAEQVRQQAWCPYSKFAVGASLITRSGQLFSGCNVENASYGLCICAERSAIVQAVAAGHRDICGIAVCADPLAWPCGACRQFIVEFGPEIEIRAFTPGQWNQAVGTSIAQLLPHYFRFEPPAS